MRRSRKARSNAGFTLVEVLIAVTTAALLVAGLSSAIDVGLAARADARQRNALARDARFAMERMVRAVSGAPELLIPMVEDPITPNIEAVIDPGLLAVRLDSRIDRDLDGFADSDNDKDGRIDEDYPSDASNDMSPGLRDIDDDNSGITDFSFAGNSDDDETGTFGGGNEDPINGIDDDGDQSIDEDPGADMNGDGAPGLAGMDDDGDGSTDEGSPDDDDEDGSTDEDWIDAVVFHLNGTDLVERFPNLNPSSGSDYTERTVARDVSQFRVERRPLGSNRAELVDILLTLERDGASVVLQTQVRVGGRL